MAGVQEALRVAGEAAARAQKAYDSYAAAPVKAAQVREASDAALAALATQDWGASSTQASHNIFDLSCQVQHYWPCFCRNSRSPLI